MKRLIAVALVAGLLVAIPASHQFTVKADQTCGVCGQTLACELRLCAEGSPNQRAACVEYKRMNFRCCLAGRGCGPPVAQCAGQVTIECAN